MGPPSRVGLMIEFGLSKLSFNFDPSILCPNPRDLHGDNAGGPIKSDPGVLEF